MNSSVIMRITISTLTLTLILGSKSSLAVNNPQQYTLESANADGSNTWSLNVSQTTATGVIKFNDWGYTGPMGASVNDFEIAGGFNSAKLGQIQSVKTIAPDYLTPDPSANIWTDKFGGNTEMPNANMDGSVNFYRWGYTTPESNFYNMQIDTPGNYLVAKEDMQFGFYDTFSYVDTTGPVSDWDTKINFQPYAISDGIGWCGSTMISNPNGVDTMAGQITFDFAFDAYLFDGGPGINEAAPQVVPGFVMRSYGEYEVDVTYLPASREMDYWGSAVGNNMDPESITVDKDITTASIGVVDPSYHNKVSFLGAGVVPDGVWVSADSYDEFGNRVLNADGTWNLTVVAEGTAGAVWHSNDFGGYAFLLRADAERTLEWISPDGHSDYVATDPDAYDSIKVVPVPAAVWLFGSGLIGLIGVARRKS